MLFRSPSLAASGGILAAALVLGTAGCNEETTELLTDDSSSEAALLFRLSDFLGDVPCSAAPGAMRSYVVTLVDRTLSDICGDGVCLAPETAESCARDCADPAPCGDGVCKEGAEAEGGETADTCPVDCGGTLVPPFTLPSSLPVPCSLGVRFDDVVGNHRYSVYVDGYEAFADEIGPFGWDEEGCKFTCPDLPETQANVQQCAADKECADKQKDADKKTCVDACQAAETEKCQARCPSRVKAVRSGSRHMFDDSHPSNPLSPRWVGACGDGDEERTVVAETGTTVVLTCAPPVDLGTASPPSTGALIDPQATLGDLSCATKETPGVAEFDISLDGTILYPSAPCSGEPYDLPYAVPGLLPGTTLDFFVAARATKDGPVTWGATCSAFLEKGLTVNAACVPLSDKGSILVGEGAVHACKDGVSSYDVALTGDGVTLQKNDAPCGTPLSFGPFPPGAYTLTLTGQSAEADPPKAACTAAVEPGRTAIADCLSQ